MVEKSVVQVNYWKEMRKELNRTLQEFNGLVLVTHNSIEFSDVVNFLNKIRKHQQLTILYISLVNSFKNIRNVLEESPLESKNLFVVDCVSGFLIELQDSTDCVYRKPPKNLKEMKDLIQKNINLARPNMIIIDSLSQFINFSNPTDSELHELYGFLKTLKQEVINVTCDTILLLYDDQMGSMKKLPTLFTDAIFKIEVIKEIPEWQD